MDENDSQVKVYPNPSQSSVFIEAKGMNRVEVYNPMGQCVLSRQIDADQTVIDVQRFASGPYLIRVETTSGIVNKRITVTH